MDAEDRAVSFSPRGAVLATTPPVVELEPDPLQSLIDGNRERGAAPDWRS